MNEWDEWLLETEVEELRAKRKKAHKAIVVGNASLVLEHKKLCKIPIDKLTTEQLVRINYIESLYGNRIITKADVDRMGDIAKELYEKQYK